MDMDISMDIHAKSVDMDMDMDGKFHIHGNPEFYCYFTVTQTRQVALFKYRPVLKLAAVTVISCATYDDNCSKQSVSLTITEICTVIHDDN